MIIRTVGQERSLRVYLLGVVMAGLLLLASLFLLASGRAIETQVYRALAHAACPEHYSHNDYELRFFVLGDWGRAGSANQRLVAALMGLQGDTCYSPQFIISTGDNFYSHGLRGPRDPYFAKTFTDVYSAPSLQVPFYAVLGNHDYGEFGNSRGIGCMAPNFTACPPHCCYSASWQDSLTSPSITGKESVAAADPRWNLKQGAWRKGFGGNNLMDVIFLDTTPFIKRYKNKAWANMSGGLHRQDARNNFIEARDLIHSSSAMWKVVVGHHPIRSYGEHCIPGRREFDCVDMEFWKPIFEEEKVDIYFSGHDHGQQYIKEPDSPVNYFISGAGSNTKPGWFKKVLANDSLFLTDEPGFVAVSIKGSTLRLDTFSIRSPSHTQTFAINK